MREHSPMPADTVFDMIERAGVVSFDVFDTLLARRHYYPADVFSEIGRSPWSCRGPRILAEWIARRVFRAKRDITLAQIYRFIPGSPERELLAETRSLHVNPAGRALYEHAVALGKRVIAASDMYLPESHVREFLDAHGYTEIDRIYVSCETGFTKSHGDLFAHIAKDLGVPAEQILHIGDNETADVTRAREHGLRAYHLPNGRTRFEASGAVNPAVIRALVRSRNPSHSLALGLMRDALPDRADDRWYCLGFSVGGLLLAAGAPDLRSPVDDEGVRRFHDGARDFMRGVAELERLGYKLALKSSAGVVLKALFEHPRENEREMYRAVVAHNGDERYRLGYDTLGPLFAAFAQRLLDEAKRDGVTRLAFVARDGEFLREVTSAFIARHGLRSTPSLDYVYLSRVSTSLPQHEHFGPHVLDEARTSLAASMNVGAFLGYYGLDASRFKDDLQRHGLRAEEELQDVNRLRALVNDRAFLDKVNQESARKRQLLSDYVREQRLIDDPATALVDIGWRGSIPAALARTFQPKTPIRCYYLAYWDDRGGSLPAAVNMTGLLGDSQVDRDPRSGAPYYAAFVLESVCRASHGIVLGYENTVPVLDERRAFEREAEAWREPIRAGILDYVARGKPVNAQRHIEQLAFFPSDDQITAVAGLAHTENFAEGWSRSLVTRERSSPLLSPRRWLAGLSSPWRTAYIHATGGWPLARLHLALESVLMRFPGLRRTMRRVALRLAR